MPPPKNYQLTPRSKTGCFTCRRRHKKCDEVRPICSGCIRNHLLCSWPSLAASDTENPESSLSSDLELPLVPAIIRQPSTLPPLFRNKQNNLLFQHFATVTSIQLASRVYPENAYLTYNLRLAPGCDGLQHAILAISSCHVSYMNSSLTDSSLDHYVVALRGLTHTITRWKSCAAMDRILAVATSLALCQFEVLTANTEGSLYHHLRAVKWMISEMQKTSQIYDQNILGFFIEQYQYLAIVSHLGFGFGLISPRGLEEGTAPQSLSMLNKGSPIYGFMFGHAHHLFSLIPRIHKLAQRRWLDKQIPGQPSDAIEATYSTLLADIMTWEDDSGEPDLCYQISGRIYQQALIMYLYLAYHGPNSPTTGLIAKVEPCVELCLHHIESMPPDAYTWTTSMWPSLVSGSCMFLESQRKRLSRILTDSLIRFPTLEGIHAALQLFWKELDNDPDLYGPHGFEMTMKRHNIILCVG